MLISGLHTYLYMYVTCTKTANFVSLRELCETEFDKSVVNLIVVTFFLFRAVVLHFTRVVQCNQEHLHPRSSPVEREYGVCIN